MTASLLGGDDTKPAQPGPGGSSWVGLSIAASAVAQMGLLVAFGRTLPVATFGIAAGALAVLSALRMLVEAVLPAALIQRADLNDRTVRTSATLTVGIAAAAAVLLWVAAPGLESLFRLDDLSSWLRWPCPGLLLHGLAATPHALLQRELRFRSVAIVDSTSLLVGYLGVGLSAAVLGAGVPLLGLAYGAEGLLRLTLVKPTRPSLPTFDVDRADVRSLFRFTGSIGVGSGLNLLATRGDYFVVSRLLGALALGAYTQAYQLAFNPGLIVGRLAARWLFPVLSRSHRDRDLVRTTLMAGVSVVGWLSATAAVVVFITAPDIVPALFGPNWGATVEPLRILSLAVPARVLSTVCDSQLKASGLVGERTRVQALYAVAVLALTALGAMVDLRWASIGVVVAVHLSYGAILRLAVRGLGSSVGETARAHLGVAVGAAVAFLVVAPTVALTRMLTDNHWIVLAAAAVPVAAITVLFGVATRDRLRGGSAGGPLDEADRDCAGRAPEPSERLVALIERFERAGVTAVAFKGGERLDQAMTGHGDLDLHVPPEDLETAREVLDELRFVEMANAPWREQRGLSDWFGSDRDGSLLHVQIYERLNLGPIQGPDVEVVYPGRLVDAAFDGLPGRRPAAATDAHGRIIRLCTAALAPRLGPGKPRHRMVAKAREPGAAGRDDVAIAAFELFDDERLAEVARDAIDGRRLGPLRRRLISNHRSADGGRRRYRSVAIAWLSALNRRTLRRPSFARRGVGRAPIIAVIGSDGSGKSTLTTRLVAELDTKIDARHLYFGTGDGSSSLLRRPLVLLRRIWERRRQHTPAEPTGSSEPRTSKSEPPQLARIAWAITTLLERRSKMRRAQRAADRGIVIVTDRYPQHRVSGVFDGPRLAGREGLRGLARQVAQWEHRGYEDLARFPPDLVLHLDVPHDVAMARRPEEDPAELERRIELARNLDFSETWRITIDASMTADEVMARALEAILVEVGRP